MSTVRIFEIAKEFNRPNDEVIGLVRSLGIDASDHLTQLKTGDAVRVKDALAAATKTVERRQGTVIRRSGTKAPVASAPAPVPVSAPVSRAPEPVVRRPVAPIPPPPPGNRMAARPSDMLPPPERAGVPTGQVADGEAPADYVPTPEVVVGAPVEMSPESPVVQAPPQAAAPGPLGEPTLERAVVVRAAVSDKVMRAIEATRREKGYDGQSQYVEGRPRNEREPAPAETRDTTSPLSIIKKKPALPPAQPGRRNLEEEKQRKYRHIILEGDDLRGGARGSKKKKLGKVGKMMSGPTPMKDAKRVVKMGAAISVGELAAGMAVKATEVIQRLFALGQMATINQAIDFDTASLVADEFGWRVESVAFDLSNYLEAAGDAESLEPRPPVVTVMGHVDHGKTSLLDSIRKARVADGEAGGITQHIGAYTVDLPGRGRVVFIDTPGHEAFTAMRARGSKATDIVVLVVAADDGVMPQTIESINHAKAAEVPIVVAINKVDKESANPERVLNELTSYGLVSEEWGGETQMIKVSATKGTGIDALLEALLLQAEVLELRASRIAPAKGLVLESRLERGRGPVATLLVQEGVLETGDVIVSGSVWGRVRALSDDKGRIAKEAGPATPVEVIGLSSVPVAGDPFYKVKDDKAAQKIVEHQLEQNRLGVQAQQRRRVGDNIYEMIAAGELTELKVVVKADVHGSAEALKEAIEKLSRPEVGVKVIHTAVGGINESDVNLAKASRALIIGFSVRPEAKAKALAEQENVEIRLYSIIYEALEEIEKAMAGLLSPVQEEEFEGRVEVRATFSVPKIGTIAGCFVTEGVIRRSAKVRLVRDSKVIYTGSITSLRRFKNDAKEVQAGYECGVGIGYNDLKEGDLIESFKITERAATLSEQST